MTHIRTKAAGPQRTEYRWHPHQQRVPDLQLRQTATWCTSKICNHAANLEVEVRAREYGPSICVPGRFDCSSPKHMSRAEHCQRAGGNTTRDRLISLPHLISSRSLSPRD